MVIDPHAYKSWDGIHVDEHTILTRLSKNQDLVPLWICLSNLPIEIWNIKIIVAIAKAMGTLVSLDNPKILGNRMTEAHFCVNVDNTKKLPKRIFLYYEDESWEREISCENLPIHRNVCTKFVHLVIECSKKKNEEKETTKIWREVAKKPIPTQAPCQNSIVLEAKNSRGNN